MSLNRWSCRVSSITHVVLISPPYPCMTSPQFLLPTPSPCGQHLHSHRASTFVPTESPWSQSAILGVTGHFHPRNRSHYSPVLPSHLPLGPGNAAASVTPEPEKGSCFLRCQEMVLSWLWLSWKA
ncbi:hypothetical protein HJG60_010094 [Phyllostomus discolor]|uniref:Uncharacterized protein n=1 Tax=Phyllostomus discolor TaxID=89673 RepID=A0A834AS24_9CHIR|nr:hypothetical protein HJG60_010094 [Phyllostomus discolor]